MLRSGVFAAFFQAVLDRVEASVVAFLAEVKTLVQLFRQVFVNIVHNFPFVVLFMYSRAAHLGARNPAASVTSLSGKCLCVFSRGVIGSVVGADLDSDCSGWKRIQCRNVAATPCRRSGVAQNAWFELNRFDRKRAVRAVEKHQIKMRGGS